MLYSELKNNSKFIDNVSVKSYLPLLLKKAIVYGNLSDTLQIDGLIASCFVREGSMYYIDYFRVEVALFYAVITLYTDIELNDENIYEQYDWFKSSGTYDVVINKIGMVEWSQLCDFIDKALGQELKIRNSMERVVGDALEVLVNKIPNEKQLSEFLKKLPNIINKIKPETLEVLKNTVK